MKKSIQEITRWADEIINEKINSAFLEISAKREEISAPLFLSLFLSALADRIYEISPSEEEASSLIAAVVDLSRLERKRKL